MNRTYDIVKHPITTEKAVRLMDMENKLVFAVNLKSNKSSIKKAVEDAFGVKVVDVNTFITSKGQKRAYVKLSKESPAIDIMTKLGLM